MKLKKKNNLKKVEKKKDKQIILNKLVEIVSSGSSIHDILLNSSQIILDALNCSHFAVYIMEKNVLKCLLKRSQIEDINMPAEIPVDETVLNQLNNIKRPVLDSKIELPFIYKYFNLPSKFFMMITPIINIGELIGVVLIFRPKKNFEKNESSLIFTIASLLASTFYRTKNMSQSDEMKKQMDALIKISKSLVNNKDVGDVLKTIVNIVADVMNFKICSVMLYNPQKEELSIKATQSLSENYINKPNLKVGESLSGMAIKEKKPITAIDVTKHPRYKYPEIAKKEGLKSMLAVPMMVKEKIIGVINVYTTNEHIFSEEEVKLLSSIADLAAIALENAQLEQEALKAKDALEARKVVERAKGILMKANNISEEEAYTTMRKKAMDLCKPLKEIAEAIILSNEINKKDNGAKMSQKNFSSSDAKKYHGQNKEESGG